MSNDKDHLRDQLDQRRRAEEETYFEKQNRAAIEKIRAHKAAGTAPATPTVRCPRDGEPLVSRTDGGTSLDVCPKCEGIWLDKGELKQAAARERNSWLGRLIFGSPKS